MNRAYLINREGARLVAIAAGPIAVPINQISTDYVYDGTKPTPYQKFRR